MARVHAGEKPEQPGEQTDILFRRLVEGEQWKPYAATISSRVVALSTRGTDLIALTGGGEWMLLWDGGSRGGSPLRMPGKLIALAGDEDSLWGIAMIRGGMTDTTRPASQSAGAATAPTTTAPATTTTASTGPAITTAPAPRAVLLSLDKDLWIQQAELPEELDVSEGTTLALGVIDGAPAIAAIAGDGGVRAFRFSASHAWQDMGLIPAAAAVDVRWLTPVPRPTLWIAGAAGAGALYEFDGKWSKPTDLAAPANLSGANSRAICVAGERIRLLYGREAGKKHQLFEQLYGMDGRPAGEPALQQIEVAPDTKLYEWINYAAIAALLLAMAGTMRRRRTIQESLRAAGKISLAPLRLRFLAGLTDALPVVITTFISALWLSRHIEPRQNPTVQLLNPGVLYPIAISWGVYLLHTLVCELIFTRTIGKMIFGLRVVALNGQRPSMGALAIRNLLRFIDLWLLFPLLLVFYSPLRQRIGDMAAGTLVISNTPLPEGEEPHESQDGG
jgi:uncharacterized RDD family membrane protein YckC